MHRGAQGDTRRRQRLDVYQGKPAGQTMEEFYREHPIPTVLGQDQLLPTAADRADFEADDAIDILAHRRQHDDRRAVAPAHAEGQYLKVAICRISARTV